MGEQWPEGMRVYEVKDTLILHRGDVAGLVLEEDAERILVKKGVIEPINRKEGQDGQDSVDDADDH